MCRSVGSWRNRAAVVRCASKCHAWQCWQAAACQRVRGGARSVKKNEKIQARQSLQVLA